MKHKESNIIKNFQYEIGEERSTDFLSNKKITEIMTRRLITCATHETVHNVLSLMINNDVNCIVMEKEGMPVGILTNKDISNIILKGKNIEVLSAKEEMSSPVVTIHEDTDDQEAIKVMTHNEVSRLVVVDKNGRIAGLVSFPYIGRGTEKENVKKLKNEIIKKERGLKETREALTDISAYLENILLFSTETAIVATDFEFKVKYCNPAAEKILGLKRKNIIGRTVKEIHSFKNVNNDRFANALKSLEEKGEYEFSSKLITDEGSRFFSNRISYIKNSEDEKLGYVYFCHDITERIKMEEALLNEGRAYRTLFEDSPIALWEVDCSEIKSFVSRQKASASEDFSNLVYKHSNSNIIREIIQRVRIIDVNKGAMDLHEAESKDELKNGLGNLFTEESFPSIKKAVSLFLEGKRKYEFETITRTFKGNMKNVIVKCSVAPSFEMSYARVLVSIFDITEQKNTEARLIQALDENDLLMREMHYRVKNNLQIVCSLFNLQKDTISDREAVEMIGECQNRIRAIALVHEKLYHSGSLAKINIREYIDDLLANIMNLYEINPNIIELTTEIQDIQAGISSAIPCGLIINELAGDLFQNALLLRSKSHIKISIRLTRENKINIIIYGEGINVRGDYDNPEGNNLGVQLVNTLIKQLNGGFDIIKDQNNTGFNIIFQLKE